MFLDLVKGILIAILILAVIRLTVEFAAYSDQQAALRTQASSEVATPSPAPCHRRYAKHNGAQRITFTQVCEDRP